MAAGRGLLSGCQGSEVTAYEIHMGVTTSDGYSPHPFVMETRSGRSVDLPDGAMDEDGLTLGTYLHGLFHNRAVRRSILECAASRKGVTLPEAAQEIEPGAEYDKLASLVREHLDMELVYRVMGTGVVGVREEDGPPARVLARGTASAPGTCGELAQGLLDGTPVMATCPIDMFSTATVELSEGTGRVRGHASLPKARRAVGLTLALTGRSDVDARLSIESPLPRRKGMASSTADIVAAIGATAAALDAEIPVLQQAELALAIEPSDGVMLPGIALFDHRGRTDRSISGRPAASEGLGVGVRGRRRHRVVQRRRPKRGAPETVAALPRRTRAHHQEGWRSGDGELVGCGATQSALAYQEVLPKPQLPAVLALGRAAGAMGVNVAHSGTVIGLLFGEDADRAKWAADEASEATSEPRGRTRPPAHRRRSTANARWGRVETFRLLCCEEPRRGLNAQGDAPLPGVYSLAAAERAAGAATGDVRHHERERAKGDIAGGMPSQKLVRLLHVMLLGKLHLL